jgi:transglutaminase-like putative cysteine protease
MAVVLLGLTAALMATACSRPAAIPTSTPCADATARPGAQVCGPDEAGGQPVMPSLAPDASITYAITETLRVANHGPGAPDKQNLWVALIGDAEPNQRLESMTIAPPAYTLVSDEYGNHYAEFDLSGQPPGQTIPISIVYRVVVSEASADPGSCRGPLPTEFTQPELHIESDNPQIVALARELAQGKATACDKARAFYDYIGNHLVYSFNGRNWGAQAALGEMGADCTEYSDLLIALSRAAGIPARYVEGLAYFADDASAGALLSDARTEHAWVEVFLPGSGWTPIDPTLGRSSLARAAYFAHLPPDHILITRGRNPSTLRGASYFTHLYWPGKSADIRIEDFGWEIKPVGD